MASRRKARMPQWKSRDGDLEEESADEAEDGVAEVFVKRRHGSGLDLAAEAIAHDEVVALFEFGEEAGSWPKS